MKKIVALVLSLALVLALGTVAFATQGDTYYTKTTDETKATASDVTLAYEKALEPKTDKNGVQTAGHVANYTLSNTGDTRYTAVDSLAKADVVVYSDEAMKNVVLYLAKTHREFYDAKVFANFGDKCGQCDYAGYDKSVTYYTVNGRLYAADKAGDQSLRVDGKFVTATFKGDLGPLMVKHVAVPVLKDATPVGYECANCKLAAVEAPNFASIPATAAQDGLTGNWYWPAAAAATTPTTSGVTSAKTFDAGVAMYAGLALMSVAGSAVVIGKKKEF